MKLAATAQTYNVTINTPANGTVTADKAAAAENESVTLTITPDSGYELTSITINSSENYISYVVNNQLVFQMPASNAEITAVFAAAAATPTAEPAYAEWFFSDVNSATPAPTVTGSITSPTMTANGASTTSKQTTAAFQYDTLTGTKQYAAGDTVYGVKGSSSSTLNFTTNLTSNTEYSSYDILVQFAHIKNETATITGLSVKDGSTTLGESETAIGAQWEVGTISIQGATADTFQVVKKTSEAAILYVGIKYNPASGTQSVSGTAQTASLSSTDDVSYVNESINSVIASGLAQIIMGGTTFSAIGIGGYGKLK